MNDRAYNRIANILMLIGIGSAFLFDSGRVPHSVAGGIGIIAGVAAAVLYFCNKSEKQTKQEEAVMRVLGTGVTTQGAEVSEFVQFASPICRQLAFEWANPYLNSQVSWRGNVPVGRYRLTSSEKASTAETYRREAARLWLSSYALQHARTLRWSVPKDASLMLMQPEVELSLNEVAACALEIVRNLAVADKLNEWEYALGPRGLRVSVRAHRTQAQPTSQEDLEFDPLSSFRV